MTMARRALPAAATAKDPALGPVGARGIGLLRRVRAEGGAYRCPDGDRETAGRCLGLGYIRTDSRDRGLLRLTDDGIAFLDGLMRAH